MLLATALGDYSKEIVLALVTTVVIPFVIQYLRAAAQSRREAAAKDATDRKTNLRYTLESWLIDAAANMAERRFPLLAQRVKDKKLTTKADVRAELYSWGDDLKAEAQRVFASQNIDIIKEVGVDTLDKMIETAANKASPFPGMESAAVLLKDKVAPMLVEKGVEYTRQHVFKLVDGELKPADKPAQ